MSEAECLLGLLSGISLSNGSSSGRPDHIFLRADRAGFLSERYDDFCEAQHLVYGDAMLIYCIGCVDCEDTIAHFEQTIPHVEDEEVRAQMFVLKDKIDRMIRREIQTETC